MGGFGGLRRRADGRPVTPAHWYPASLVAAAAAAFAYMVLHRAWERAENGTPSRALLDGLSHATAALAATLPAAPFAPDPARFLAAGLAGAIALDLDHVVAAQSVRLERCMTMPVRPPTHSIAFAFLASMMLAGLRPWRGLGLGVFLGLGSHLLRDLGTGGAPLLHPRRVCVLAYPVTLVLLACLAVCGRLLVTIPPWPSSDATARTG